MNLGIGEQENNNGDLSIDIRGNLIRRLKATKTCIYMGSPPSIILNSFFDIHPFPFFGFLISISSIL